MTADAAVPDLPPRLARLAAHVPVDADVADIGADHGLLTVHLLRKNPQRQVVATDLRQAPLARTQAALAQLPPGIQQSAVLRHGWGLTVLAPGEVQVIVMAGLGGATMVDMLRKSPQLLTDLERLVLQPMQGAHPLRSWLVAHGWRLTWEELVRDDGRLYAIMVAEPGQETVADPLHLEVGPRLIDRPDPLLTDWMEVLIHRCTRVVKEMERGLGPGDRRLRRRRRHLGRLKELWADVDTRR